MSKHTPEPWHYRTLSMDGIGIWTNDTRIYQGTREQGGSEWVADVGCETDPERIANAERIIMAVNALSGIASAAPGSVRQLVEAANIIDAMPVDGCSPSVIESMLRQAKSLVYTALAAIKIEGGSDGK